MENVLVIGGKGMQLDPAEALLDIEREGGTQRFAGFLLDDTSQAERIATLGPIVGGIHEARAFAKRGYKILFALWKVDQMAKRIRLFESLEIPEESLATVISPKSYVSRLATIGPGTFVAPLVYVYNNVVIGRCNFLCPTSFVSHDSRIGDYNVISGSVHGATVGNGNFIGIHTLVDAPIGNGNFIGYRQVVREPIGNDNLVAVKYPNPHKFPISLFEQLGQLDNFKI